MMSRHALFSSSSEHQKNSDKLKDNFRKDLEFRIEADNYKLAYFAAGMIQKVGLIQSDALTKPMHLEVFNNGELNGAWLINYKENDGSYFNTFFSPKPFAHLLEEKNVVHLKIERNDPSLLSRVYNLFTSARREITENYQRITTPFSFRPLNLKMKMQPSVKEAIQTPPFSDAFSFLAQDALQRWEKVFRSQVNPKGQYRVVARHNYVEIESIKGTSLSALEKEENRSTLRAYRNYLIHQYGYELINYIEYQYHINLLWMIQQGQPLLPEHIYRFNIGINNIELQSLEVLHKKILKLCNTLDNSTYNPDEVVTSLWNDLNCFGRRPEDFTVRELRGLILQINPEICGDSSEPLPTIKEFHDFIQNFKQSPGESFEDLLPECFAQLMKALVCPRLYRNRIYTGKKIIRKSIAGFYNEKSQGPFQPWLDQQCLNQILPKFSRQDNLKNYFEILSHVIQGKHLVRKHPLDNWRVGSVIPAPKDVNGIHQYYKVQSCLDDGRGNLVYTLTKVCAKSNLPSIKLYRDTIQTPYALEEWHPKAKNLEFMDFLDVKDMDRMDLYEKPFFNERTIPVWIGYYLKANNLHQRLISSEITEDAQHAIWHQIAQDSLKAVQLMKQDLTLTNLNIPEKYNNLSLLNTEALKKLVEKYSLLLKEKGKESKELPEFKKSEDIAFVGYSYGGAVAQSSFSHFAIKQNRLPMPGQKYICYASNTPGVQANQSKDFFEFGKQHSNLLNFLKQKWDMIFQFESGDFIQTKGESFLVSSDLDEKQYNPWVNIDIEVFKPLDGAISEDILSTGKHQRRIGDALEDIDFVLHKLYPKDLKDFHSSWWLNPKLQEIFGLGYLSSPKTFDSLRKAYSIVAPFITTTMRKINQYFFEANESNSYEDNGSLFVSYSLSKRSVSEIEIEGDRYESNQSL